jgi:serine protease Do
MNMHKIYCLLSLLFFCQQGLADKSAWEKEAPESVADLIAIQKQVQKVLPKCMAATVTLQMGGSSGSGVVVNKEGLVLTAGHVSGTPGRSVKIILADGRELKGKALGMNGDTDSGLVQIADPPDDLPVVEYDKSEKELPKIGQWCIAVGNPGGLDKDRGVVVRVGRVISARSDTIRTDCMLLGGDSGGPLFNFNGVVIGIHSRISSRPDSNMHVSMPAFQADWKALNDSKALGKRSGGGRPRLTGTFLGVLSEDHAQGALVIEVREDTPAFKAGLKKDDIIQKVNDIQIKNAQSLTDEIRKFKPSTKVRITLLREGNEKVLEAELEQR